jgi:hypothetical protein
VIYTSTVENYKVKTQSQKNKIKKKKLRTEKSVKPKASSLDDKN